MRELIKKLAVPLISAVLGGAIVLVGLKLMPNLSQKMVSSNEQKQAPAHTSSTPNIDDILKKQTDIQNQFNNMFNDDFFGQRDPFAQMKKMRKEMEKRMEEFTGENQVTKNPFDSWYSEKFGGGSIEDVSMRQDDSFVYYDIKIENLNLTSLNTKIENGHISVTGSVEKRDDSNENGNFHSYFKSTFVRTFPVPEGVDTNKMETIPEKDKITLKFPKLKT